MLHKFDPLLGDGQISNSFSKRKYFHLLIKVFDVLTLSYFHLFFVSFNFYKGIKSLSQSQIFKTLYLYNLIVKIFDISKLDFLIYHN